MPLDSAETAGEEREVPSLEVASSSSFFISLVVGDQRTRLNFGQMTIVGPRRGEIIAAGIDVVLPPNGSPLHSILFFFALPPA